MVGLLALYCFVFIILCHSWSISVGLFPWSSKHRYSVCIVSTKVYGICVVDDIVRCSQQDTAYWCDVTCATISLQTELDRWPFQHKHAWLHRTLQRFVSVLSTWTLRPRSCEVHFVHLIPLSGQQSRVCIYTDETRRHRFSCLLVSVD